MSTCPVVTWDMLMLWWIRVWLKAGADWNWGVWSTAASAHAPLATLWKLSKFVFSRWYYDGMMISMICYDVWCACNPGNAPKSVDFCMLSLTPHLHFFGLIFTKRIKSSEWHLAGQVEIPLQEGRGDVLCVPNESFAIHKNFSIQAFDFDGFVLKKFVWPVGLATSRSAMLKRR